MVLEKQLDKSSIAVDNLFCLYRNCDIKIALNIFLFIASKPN